MMVKSWEVEANGTKHKIEYKAGFGAKVTVDGEVYKVKSSNWFVNMVDYSITFGETQCRLVVIGGKVDLAVNGTYLGSGKAYEPLSSVPIWVYVLVGFSTIGGFLISGLYGLLIGVVMSTLYVNFALNKKTGALIGCFVACTAIQFALFFLVLTLQVTMGI